MTQTIWHLYVIRTADDTLYTGITTDVKRRFGEHCGRGKKGAAYLRGHRPARVAFSRRIGTRSLASKVEYHVKQLPRSAKLAIIRSKKLSYDKTTGEIIALTAKPTP